MEKINEFFINELHIENEKKTEIENEIYRAELDIEFIQKTMKRILWEADNTQDVFSASGKETSFYDKEAELLNEQKIHLEEKIVDFRQKLTEIDNRIQLLEEMLVETKNKNTEPENMLVFSVKERRDILEIQEMECQRIARDIHDSIVQKMTSLIHKSEFTMKVIETDVIRARLELEVIHRVIKECIDEMREVIFNLRPMSYDDLGLNITLKRIVAQMNKQTDMKITLNYEDHDININSVLALTVLRIIQELCSNSIKYSKGTMITINICMDKNKLIIIHEDDGVGYIKSDINFDSEHNTGFGLTFLYERVRLLNGIIRFENEKGKKGTRYYIEIPYSEWED